MEFLPNPNLKGFFESYISEFGPFLGPKLATLTLIDVKAQEIIERQTDPMIKKVGGVLGIEDLKEILLFLRMPQYRKGIIQALIENFPTLDKRAKTLVIRAAFAGSEKIKIADQSLSDYIAKNSAFELLGFTPNFPHFETFETFLEALFPDLPYHENKPYLFPGDDFPLTPESFERMKQCLLAIFEWIKIFWENPDSVEGLVISRECFPNNFLEFINKTKKVIEISSFENFPLLSFIKPLFLTFIRYLQEPFRLQYLQGFVDKPTGVYLTELITPLLIILSFVEDFLKRNYQQLSWEETTRLVTIEEAEEEFPQVSEVLNQPPFFPLSIYKTKYEEKEYYILIATIVERTRICIIEKEDDVGNPLLAIGIEQVYFWAKNATSSSLPLSVQFIKRKVRDDDAGGRAFGFFYFTSTDAAMKYANEKEGREAHQTHETGHLELRKRYPYLSLTPFLEEGILYAMMERPDMTFLEEFLLGVIPNGHEAIYGRWDKRGYYGLAWITMEYLKLVLLSAGITIGDILPLIEELQKKISGNHIASAFIYSPVAKDFLLQQTLRMLSSSHSYFLQRIWGEGNLGLLMFQALLYAPQICRQNLERYRELRGPKAAEKAEEALREIEQNPQRYFLWVQQVFSSFEETETKENNLPQEKPETNFLLLTYETYLLTKALEFKHSIIKRSLCPALQILSHYFNPHRPPWERLPLRIGEVVWLLEKGDFFNISLSLREGDSISEEQFYYLFKPITFEIILLLAESSIKVMIWEAINYLLSRLGKAEPNPSYPISIYSLEVIKALFQDLEPHDSNNPTLYFLKQAIEEGYLSVWRFFQKVQENQITIPSF